MIFVDPAAVDAYTAEHGRGPTDELAELRASGRLDAAEDVALSSGAVHSDLEWIQYCSPPETWHLWGRAGWLLVDRRTKKQHHFLTLLMN